MPPPTVQHPGPHQAAAHAQQPVHPYTPEPTPAPAASAPEEAPVSSEQDLPHTFFLGRYRVVDEIGVGGMASVHLARVDGPGGFQKWVAIKRIHPHLVEDDQFVDMFLDEARIAAGINHANVAQVFDLGKDDNTYWIAMEYLHGEPLREVMRRVDETETTFPFHVAARVCADAAEGLHGAHELRGRNGQLLSLVHRDVTPHNLFVTYDGYTKVVDFGIAKVIDRLASTRAGTLKGKLAYMSPEQVRGQEVDRRTDIFALGVVLWELTTNRRLFRMDTDLDTLEKVQACVVPLPSTLISGYPKDLEDVVMKALSQRKEDRFQTAREFSRALQRFLMKQGTFVGPEDVGDYIKELFAERVRKRERYLEWAAEVTSAIDVDALRQQKGESEPAAPSLLHAAAPPPEVVSAPSQSHVREAEQQAPYKSSGQNSAAAAVVTSAPLALPQAELASSSLMDEDEDIPTIVAQPRGQVSSSRGPRPAAGAPVPQQNGWDGAATQMMAESDGGFASTIALADHRVDEIHAKLDELDRQPPPMPQTPAQQSYQQPGAIQPRPADPNAMQAQPGVIPGTAVDQLPPTQQMPQGQIETKMSLPRPAAVAQWLMEQGDVEIQGPRSTGVIIAIAALATLCVMGVASLIVYKLRLPARPDSLAVTAPTLSPESLLPDDARDTGIGSNETTADKKGAKSSAKNGKGSKADADGKSGKSSAKADGKADDKPTETQEAPGKLSINCKPACDSIVAGGTSLGPSPVFSHPMPPGLQRVTLKGNGKTKTIAVQIVSGQLTTQTVSMK